MQKESIALEGASPTNGVTINSADIDHIESGTARNSRCWKRTRCNTWRLKVVRRKTERFSDGRQNIKSVGDIERTGQEVRFQMS